MWQIFFLSFREYFEAFLLIICFNVLTIQNYFHKGKAIFLGACLGLGIPLGLTISLYFHNFQFPDFFTRQQINQIEGWSLITSAILISILAFPVHTYIWTEIDKSLPRMYRRILSGYTFDWLLFSLVLLLVGKEGLEALVFASEASLSNTVSQNIIGIFLGFIVAAFIGYIFQTTILYYKVIWVFRMLAFGILLIGGLLFLQGVSILVAINLQLAWIVPFLYILAVYVIFIKEKRAISTR